MVPNYQADLVGGIPTPLKKYEFVSWDDLLFPTEWKVIIQKCLKPPTRFSGYSGYDIFPFMDGLPILFMVNFLKKTGIFVGESPCLGRCRISWISDFSYGSYIRPM